MFSQWTHTVLYIWPKTHVLGHFGPFRYSTKIGAKRAELVPLANMFAKQSWVRCFRNERTQSSRFDPKLMFWGVSDHFVIAQKSVQNGPNRCHLRTCSLTEVVSDCFATNAPNTLHLTQNSCFGVFRTVSLLRENRCKTGRTGAIREHVRKTKLGQMFSQRTHPILYIWPKTHVLGHFGPFRYSTKIGAKRAELVPFTNMFAKQSCDRCFRNERTQSFIFDLKLMFWGVLYHFVTARKLVENGQN
jgi:hypothetical protein